MAPEGVVMTSRTGSSSMRRTNGEVRASGTTKSGPATAGVHADASNPGSDQPDSSRRASYDSPA
ncbi:hypothetical protein GCM10025877_18460 [Agromyces mangrovi Wang et al. 2018]|nr:hypothetical protein GCM10025877_18460 [Agromyces mangrovi]